MIAVLQSFLDQISDQELRRKVSEYIEIYEDDLLIYPASLRFHHNYDGGLLDHTVEVVEISLKIADFLSKLGLKIDRDALVVAGLLHDFGKLEEYVFDERQKKWTHSFQRDRMDHSLFPILDFMEKTNYPLPKKICLIILGHMGGWSRTSVYPDFLESAILHAADLISSRLERGEHNGETLQGSKTRS